MSLLIKNVQIIDGLGGEPYKADVFVHKNIISAIGDLKNKEADTVIDGLGDYLAPGFIDVDASSDQYLSILTNPSQSDFTAQGVTSALGGHCGSSLAPLLYGSLESVRKWANTDKINVDWKTMDEFLKTLNKFPLGINFGTLIGHATVRRAITKNPGPLLAPGEMMVFKKVVDETMSHGAFGLSTGLGYTHGRTVPYSEIKELLDVVKKYDGLYSTHLRSETSGLIGSVEETIKAVSDTGVRTMISHFRPLIGFESQFDEAVSRIMGNSFADNFRFCLYPFDTSINPIYTLLPLWAQERDLETMLAKIRTRESLMRIEKDLLEYPTERITIADAGKNQSLNGKSLGQLADMFATSPVKALIKVMDLTAMRATVLNKNINLENLISLLADERALIGSNSSPRMNPADTNEDRSRNTFSKYLEIVIGRKLLSLQESVKRITSVPAEYLKIRKRGMIKEGYIADLTIIGKDDNKIIRTIVGGESSRGEALRHIL